MSATAALAAAAERACPANPCKRFAWRLGAHARAGCSHLELGPERLCYLLLLAQPSKRTRCILLRRSLPSSHFFIRALPLRHAPPQGRLGLHERTARAWSQRRVHCRRWCTAGCAQQRRTSNIASRSANDCTRLASPSSIAARCASASLRVSCSCASRCAQCCSRSTAAACRAAAHAPSGGGCLARRPLLGAGRLRFPQPLLRRGRGSPGFCNLVSLYCARFLVC